MSAQPGTTTIERRFTERTGTGEESLTTTSACEFLPARGELLQARGYATQGSPPTASLLPEYVGQVSTGSSAAIIKALVRTFQATDMIFQVHHLEEPDAGLGSGGSESRRRRYAAVIAMLEKWLADESGYDEQTWPMLKEQIEASRTSSRRRFID